MFRVVNWEILLKAIAFEMVPCISCFLYSPLPPAKSFQLGLSSKWRKYNKIGSWLELVVVGPWWTPWLLCWDCHGAALWVTDSGSLSHQCTDHSQPRGPSWALEMLVICRRQTLVLWSKVALTVNEFQSYLWDSGLGTDSWFYSFCECNCSSMFVIR